MTNSFRRGQQKKPQRMTITVPWSTFERIEKHATEQGRSMSNFSAYLIERALEEFKA